ncbi:hypothetical protein COS61_02060 [Candidatus Wolfebacteria bacterium CG03_land_8_20_14_0_80_40_12]|uniref:Uncharacterized protein n=1 Tax=Candidatus Wolfebacteria bacterium CG03_land_8_20_14_0_80_40_12 TaxID=1975069 RepID=A0A2M7B5A3_9BACT|nr:MAG: hypothetical protein COS61_02060 [Candidatus Wolfebacteria bacterium CG03_land_8_20_14_0_80_40_12]
MKKFLKIILIIIAAIVVLILGLIGFGFLQREYQIAKLSDYYQELAKKCKETDSFGCCITSVNIMAGGGHKLAPETGCPEGFQGNMLECISSYVWCEPVKKSNKEIDYSEPAYFEYGKTILVKSFKVGPVGGLFEIKNTDTPIDGMTIEIPKGALDKEINFSAGYNDGVLKNVRGEWSEITGVLYSEQLVDLMSKPMLIRISMKYSGDPKAVVPYAIDEKGKIHSLTTLSMDKESRTFSYATFYIPLTFTWTNVY